MRAILIAALFAVLAEPVQSQVPTVSAARVAAGAAAIQPADGARTLKYVAGGAAIGAAMWIALGAAWHTITPDICELARDGKVCERPSFVKLGLLGAVAGAIAGATIATRRGEKAKYAPARITPVVQPDGVALQFVFR
jgi:hypothetical protein